MNVVPVKYAQGKRRRTEQKARLKRITQYRHQIKTLRALVETYEPIDSDDARAELRRLKARIRTLEQQIKYTSGGEQI